MNNSDSNDATENELAHQREAVRDSLFLQSILTLEQRSEPATVRVRNLSAGGMMIESPMPFVRGERLEAELRGIGSISGRIAWSAEGRAGIAFDAPIDPMLARKPVGAGAQTPEYAKSPVQLRRQLSR